MKLKKENLEGEFVRLEPLNQSHKEQLCEIIQSGELWKIQLTVIPHPDKVEEYINFANTVFDNDEGLAFATIDKSSGKVAGTTRFYEADYPNKKVEIGYTFIGKAWQKSVINTEAKYLMLSHAFEVLKLNRVELITDLLNLNSKRAILRLGAKEEGILRAERIMPDGRIRDTIMFSITYYDWPEIKENLLLKLRKSYSS